MKRTQFSLKELLLVSVGLAVGLAFLQTPVAAEFYPLWIVMPLLGPAVAFAASALIRNPLSALRTYVILTVSSLLPLASRHFLVAGGWSTAVLLAILFWLPQAFLFGLLRWSHYEHDAVLRREQAEREFRGEA